MTPTAAFWFAYGQDRQGRETRKLEAEQALADDLAELIEELCGDSPSMHEYAESTLARYREARQR